jgi:hypothetical protein
MYVEVPKGVATIESTAGSPSPNKIDFPNLSEHRYFYCFLECRLLAAAPVLISGRVGSMASVTLDALVSPQVPSEGGLLLPLLSTLSSS